MHFGAVRQQQRVVGEDAHAVGEAVRVGLAEEVERVAHLAEALGIARGAGDAVLDVGGVVLADETQVAHIQAFIQIIQAERVNEATPLRELHVREHAVAGFILVAVHELRVPTQAAVLRQGVDVNAMRGHAAAGQIHQRAQVADGAAPGATGLEKPTHHAEVAAVFAHHRAFAGGGDAAGQLHFVLHRGQGAEAQPAERPGGLHRAQQIGGLA